MMRVFYGFDSLPHFAHPAATVGSYDGVHLGHRALIERLVAEAHRAQGESVVLTFDPHPRVTLHRAEGLRILTPLDEKIRLFELLGVDNLIVIPFDRAFSTLSGQKFIDEYILGKVGAETLIVGYNHRFGHDRIDGHALAATHKLKIVQVDECNIGGEHISSTVIRKLIDNGKIAEAERLLGHPLQID
ncbi:MAG: FAD synthetase family protein [Alistipes sp.]